MTRTPHPDKANTSWADNCRADGTLVVQGFEGNWFVLANDDRACVDRCPVCGNVFATAEEARRAADAVYPPA